MERLLFTGAKLVLADSVVEDADLLIEDGFISGINTGSASYTQRVDLDGQLLIPGAIDLHCDILEKEIEPRPNVRFPFDFAVFQSELRFVTSGITVAYHALSFAGRELGIRDPAITTAIIRFLRGRRPQSLIEHRVHARYELTYSEGLEAVRRLVAEGCVDMVSFMDHTPGRGQFKTLEAYRRYLRDTYHKSEAEIDALIAFKNEQSCHLEQRAKQLVAVAREAGIPVASHDDDSPRRIEEVASMGVTIAEFPVTIAAAQKAVQLGLVTVFGAPNVLRRGSQSNSASALEAIRQGVATCLCSDYSPASLIPATLSLPSLLGLGLADAVGLITKNPAKAVGLTDRGEIALGKRADLVAVDNSAPLPRVTGVWVAGRRVFCLPS